ncbi:hypothetical protein [Parageobacillus thermoglucosidasius]|uniref:hypothetical protein n=1 Tax=Parageobacillus thermoglucosidasius TaxID=1426 RepID=UPI001E3F1170|nr:hypothetical protein [Parageobacillus thermoglucosidasius]
MGFFILLSKNLIQGVTDDEKKTTITPESTLLEGFNEFEKSQPWSKNTRRSYRKNVINLSDYMLKQGLEPVSLGTHSQL